MPSLKLLALTNLVAQIAAHGHVDWIIADGVAYRGYDAPAFSWNPSSFPVAGWITAATDNGYVEPNSFTDPDIICHRAARNARGHIAVSAGDKINLQWNTWPESHKGPVIDYLAKCPGNCQNVDKTELEFFKISAEGLIDMSMNSGYWASDVLIGNGNSWTVQIPSDLASGNYVLRHEIIALHGSGQPNGAQNYPQCFNIKVTGGGDLVPEGVKGTKLYKADDPGILFNLYTTPLLYKIPGPTLVSGLPSTVQQRATSATATSSATIPGQEPTSSSSSSSSSKTTTTTSTTSRHSNSTTSSTTSSSKETTLKTTTTSRSSTSSTSQQDSEPTDDIMCGPVHGQAKYAQCGGKNYVGPTVCAWGATCNVVNEYYWQCL